VKSTRRGGVKQSLKLEIYKLSKPPLRGDGVTFCIWVSDFGLTSKLSRFSVGVAKAMLIAAIEFVDQTQKPGDLACAG